jgi:hypothetical protein
MQSEGREELVTNSFGMKPAQGWGAHILLGSNQRRACLRERSGRRWELFSI